MLKIKFLFLKATIIIKKGTAIFIGNRDKKYSLGTRTENIYKLPIIDAKTPYLMLRLILNV